MICKYCNQEKGDKFRVCKVINGKSYRRKKCNDCWFEQYKGNRKKIRAQIDEYKSKQKCEICGFDDWRALQFHHKKGEDKLFEIGNAPQLGFSINKIKKEIDKCQVICANCHQILHHIERNPTD